MAIDLNRYKLNASAQPNSPSGGMGMPDVGKYRTVTGPNVPTQDSEPKRGFLSQFASNAVRSGRNFIGGIYEAASRPQETFDAILDVGAGAVGALDRKLGIDIKNPGPEQAADMERQRKAWSSVVEFYKERYGGIENLKRTVYEDPVGFVGDLSSVLGVAGGAVSGAGNASKLASVSRAGEAISAAGRTVDPLAAATRGLGLGLRTATQNRTVGGQSFRPEVASAAKELGVELPASALSSSKVTQGTEALLGRGFFGRNIGEQVAKAREQVQRAAELNVERVNQAIGRATAEYAGDVRSSADIGRSIQEGFDSVKGASEANRSALYDAVPREVASQPADFAKTLEAVNSTLDRMDLSSVSPQGRATIERIRQDLIDAQPTVRQKEVPNQAGYARKFVDETVPPKRPMTFESLKATRTQVGRMLGNRVDPVSSGIKSDLEALYASLSDDMDATVAKVSPEAKAAFDEANAANRTLMEDFNGKVAKMIQASDPEKLVDSFLKKNNQSTVETVRKVAGDEAVERLGAAFTNRLFLNSAKDGVVSVEMLKKNLAKYDPGTVETLLGPDGAARLDETIRNLEDIETQAAATRSRIGTVDDALKAGTKAADGSQTAFLQKYQVIASAAAAAVGSAIATGNIKNLFYLGSLVMGEAAMNRFFTSQLGQDFLTKGVKLEGGAGKWIMRKAPQSRVGTLPQAINQSDEE